MPPRVRASALNLFYMSLDIEGGAQQNGTIKSRTIDVLEVDSSVIGCDISRIQQREVMYGGRYG